MEAPKKPLASSPVKKRGSPPCGWPAARACIVRSPLQELVQFYQQNSLKDCFKSLDTTLQFPYKEPERRAISRPPAGSTKYFGTAKARYDFCARDRSELSLKEGDIIKILSKKGQQGWWRGEIYGRIGWFPSNYVEEDYSEYC